MITVTNSFCLCTTSVCFEPLKQKGGASGGNGKHVGGLPVVSPGTVCQWSVLGQCASGQSWASMGKNPLTGPWTKASIGQASCEVVLSGTERKQLKCRSWSQMVAHTDVSPCPVE